MKKRIIRQGDIYMCDLDGIDSEQQGVHPVLIVSIDILNNTSKNVVVFPITHQRKKPMPFHFMLYKEDYPFFLYNNNMIQPDCVRHISKRRLQRYLGTISTEDLQAILRNKEYVYVEKTYV